MAASIAHSRKAARLTLSDPLRLVLNAAMVAALAYVAVCAGLYVFQRSFIYHGGAARPEPVPGVTVRSLTTSDGLNLLAWYVPPAAPDRPVVLFLHGNAGSLAHRADRVPPFAAA